MQTRLLKHLNDLGEKVYNQAAETSRRDTGRLQDEQNYRVQPDTVLTWANDIRAMELSKE
jgi:hypothetical protein